MPDFAIIVASPTVFNRMVFPPVFGPVITRALVFCSTYISTGTGDDCFNLAT